MSMTETDQRAPSGMDEPVANRRRHVRYPIPARVAFEGTWHPVGDVSAGGFSILEAESSPRPGSPIEAQVLFPLNDYSLIMSIEGTIRYYDRELQRVGVSFAPESKGTESVIRHLIDAYVSNEVVMVGDVMEVSKRFTDAKARGASSGKKDAVKKTFRERLSDLYRYAKGAGFLLLGFALVFYVARNGYSKVFIKPATSAFVDVQSVDVGALAIGNVIGFNKAESYAKDTLILTIKDRDGKFTEVKSPCDCVVLSSDTAENSFVREGDILMRLAPRDAKPFIRAKVDGAIMMKIGPDSTADLTFRDDVRLAYQLDQRPLQTIESVKQLRDLVGIDVRMETGRDELPVSTVGETVRIVFDTSPFPWLRRLLLL
jgi:PilZ domain